MLPWRGDDGVRAREGKRGRGLLSLGLEAAGFETGVRWEVSSESGPMRRPQEDKYSLRGAERKARRRGDKCWGPVLRSTGSLRVRTVCGR